MKKALSIILSIILMFSILPSGVISVAASEVTNGTTGNCTWSLDGTVLTISGKGAMKDYTYSSNLPWGTDITEVIIEKGVTKIGNYAFYACRSLTSVTLSDGVTSIGTSSFAFCSSLKSITIPNSIKSFGDGAFYYCSSLPGIVIPDGVTSIGDEAFQHCRFKDITIPNSVRLIGEGAFLGCSFKNIVIPSSVTSIGAGVFGYCNSLTSIEVDENNTVYYSSGNCIIKKSSNVLVAGCKTSVIPNSVTSIGDSAFKGLDFISLTIPENVTRISASAFVGADLVSITIPKSITDIAYGAFYLCDTLTDVYYSGNRVDKRKINIGGNNERLTNANWHYAPCENDAHTYDYECTSICKNCDYIREINTSHIYDSNCDERCNVCDESRKPKHIFTKSGENTATCEICKISKTFDFIITTDEQITLSYEASKEFDFSIENTTIAKITNVSSSFISAGSYYRQSSNAKLMPVFPGETTIKVVASDGVVLTTSTLLVVEGEHQMQLLEILKEVNCTENGKELHKCKFCGYQEEITIESSGHKYDHACDTTCNVCSETRDVESHKYDNACDTECNICSEYRKITHDYDNATCTTPKTCKVCGETKGEALGHNYDFGIVTRNATCKDTGVKTHTCTVCKAIKTSTIEKSTIHTYSNNCDASCNVCGATRTVNHQYNSGNVTKKATTSKNGKIVKKCSVCGYTYNITTIYYPKTVKLSVTSYTYDGKTKKPTVSVKDSKGKKISSKYYTVKYANGRKNIGKYTVTVTFKGKYTGTKKLYFTIGPQNPKSVKATLDDYNNATLSWSKVRGATGYKVYWKANPDEPYTYCGSTPLTSWGFGMHDGVKNTFKVVSYKKVKGVSCNNAGKVCSIYSLKKVSDVKVNKSGAKIKVSWKNISGETGYQISQSTKKSGTNIIATYKTTSANKKLISASKGKTYYYKVRAYKVENGKKIYAPWSTPVKYTKK